MVSVAAERSHSRLTLILILVSEIFVPTPPLCTETIFLCLRLRKTTTVNTERFIYIRNRFLQANYTPLIMIAVLCLKQVRWPVAFLFVSVIAQHLISGVAFQGQQNGLAAASQLRGLRNLQGGVNKNSNCPKQYSLLRCDNPDLSYEIPCDSFTCEWNLQALDPKSPPNSCLAITIVDPTVPDIPDVIRPCALWSLIYGDHKSSSPTTLGKFLVPFFF
jgi:hypothetical protein